ncbi:MAG: NADH-quinone oxidoreductase subunit, partial [Aeromicrobium sp.]|nr:NADH-quinone oxidoreductase subunit [Aeromicrobium sp.]
LHVLRLEPWDHLLLVTYLDRADATVASIADVFAGASWHERETAEMFGISFGRDLAPLLLPDGFEGHPLRKEFVLASRVAKPWPGAKEPGESDADSSHSPSRRRVKPPGVPDGWLQERGAAVSDE